MEYANKRELIAAIRKAADAFIKEFRNISEEDKNLRLGSGERTPYENLAYQIGWMNLIQKWEKDEQEGRRAEVPARGVQWNDLGALHSRFYAAYKKYTMHELQRLFGEEVEGICWWLEDLDERDIFRPGRRNWAKLTPSDGTISKWIHTNTVASFKTFGEKMKKWKKQNGL